MTKCPNCGSDDLDFEGTENIGSPDQANYYHCMTCGADITEYEADREPLVEV